MVGERSSDSEGSLTPNSVDSEDSRDNDGLFEHIPVEIFTLILEYLPAREIIISCDRSLYRRGLYAKSHCVPAVLRLNRHLRKWAKTVYRLRFHRLLEHGAIYFNFAVDTLVIASHEAFDTFLFPLSYSPDVRLSIEDRLICRDRYYVDRELQNLAFRTFLDKESMSILVRFRKLRWTMFVERPEQGRARTRHNNIPSKDKCFKEKTIELWEKRAKSRGQHDFVPPEMVPIPLDGFDRIFNLTERPRFPLEGLYAKPECFNGEVNKGCVAIVPQPL